MPSRRGDPNQMSFLQHLDELRVRLLRCAIVLGAAFLAAWPVSGWVYDLLVAPVKEALPPGVALAYTGVSDPFMLYMKVSLFTAIVVGLPYALMEFWLFVAPGLYARERRLAIPFVAGATLFFLIGAWFAHGVIVPYTCRYFIDLGTEAGFQPVITIREVLGFVLQLVLATGAVFELPVVIFFLTRVGIVTPAFLWHYFGYSFFAIWLLAALITPPDVFSMMMVGFPMTGLYLLGILVSWIFLPRPKPAPAPSPSPPA
ncbi:MAG TPA: twin-arginine translocase subunit TatC [Candidatus Polarisedimenticolia bacterium]|nr:twin-arginine translocase subunit TatC [Candidatus Polarisedimenticolia bacterium]